MFNLRFYQKNRMFFLIYYLFFFFQNVFPATVFVDSTFGANKQGSVVTPIASSNSAQINGSALQTDGKIVVVGGYLDNNNLNNIVVARYKQNGELDATFGSGGTGIVLQNFTEGSDAFGVAIQSDGKIIVVGETAIDGLTQILVLRYTSSGVLDTGFGPDSNGKVFIPIGNGSTANDVVIQPSNQFIVVAGVAVISGFARFAVARLNTSGDLDTANFGTGGITTTAIGSGNSSAHALILRSDEKIILGGSAGGGFALAQYDTSGNLDTSNFGTSGIVTLSIAGSDVIEKIALDSNSNIVVAGKSGNNIAAAVFQADGSLNTDFNSTGYITTSIGSNAGADAMVVQSDDKIVVGGFSDDSAAVVRYNTDGSYDSSYGNSGIILTAIGDQTTFFTLALQDDGKIVAGGYSDNSLLLVRYLDSNADMIKVITPADSSTISPHYTLINGVSNQSSAQVKVTVNGNVFTTVPTDAYGNWNAGTSPLLVDGSNTVLAELIVSSVVIASDTSNFTVNGPHEIVITSPASGAIITTDTVSISGTSTRASTTVNILIDGNAFTSTTTDSQGKWLAGNSSTLVNGSHSITANLMDGSTTLATATNGFTVARPNIVTITNPAVGSTISGLTTPINGTSSDGSFKVHLFVDGSFLRTVLTDSNGNWDGGSSDTLLVGAHAVFAHLANGTGNVKAVANNEFSK